MIRQIVRQIKGIKRYPVIFPIPLFINGVREKEPFNQLRI